jgi:DNA (cytosine-5)-methyltransferase 1
MTSQMQETFGQYLKKLRIQKGFTLTQLAAELNMDSANLSKVKNGKREFDLKRLPLFCSIFQLDTKEMEIELISEQFAKSVCEKNIDNTIFELAQKKASVFSQKLYQNESETTIINLVEEEGTLFENGDWRLKEFSNPSAEIRIGTLFSGIGAIEHAFQRLKLNHSIVFASDIDPFVRQTYFANYEIGASDWHDDVTKFSASKYKNKLDILIGGSPCQAFSMVGKRKGLEDIIGTLFYDFARIVKETQPKVFIYENVKGLTNHDGGKHGRLYKMYFMN